MNRTIIYSVIFVLALIGCKQKENPVSVPQMDFATFENLLHQENDTLYVINFWATWCAPCVKELPYFEQVRKEYSKSKVKIILVSLDFPNKRDELIIPFMKEHNIQSQVIHLTDVKANRWIGKVDKAWSGAIPATVVYRGSSRKFIEGSMTYKELKSLIESKL